MGLGRIGNTRRITGENMTKMNGRCREQGCETEWHTTEEYLKCEGCSWQGCKIAANYQKRQAANAVIETDKVIERMKRRHKQPKWKSMGEPTFTGRVEETEHAIESFYIPAEGEVELVREVPPVLHFKIE